MYQGYWGGKLSTFSNIFIVCSSINLIFTYVFSATLFSSSFNTQLMHSLLRLLLVHDADVRLLVLQTFQVLADRNNNLEKLTAPTVTAAHLGLNYPRSVQGRKNGW